MSKSSLHRTAKMQALGVLIYCALIATILFNLHPDELSPEIAFGTMLFTFCVSALICPMIVFYKPYKLFIAKKQKEAGELVLLTASWLTIFLGIAFLAVFILTRL